MDKFAELLRQAAELLGLQAARLWPQMVLLHWLQGVLGLIGWPFLIGVMSLIERWLIKSAKNYKKRSTYDDGRMGWIIGAVVLGVVLIIFIIVGSFAFVNSIAQTAYPEAHLVREIIKKGS